MSNQNIMHACRKQKVFTEIESTQLAKRFTLFNGAKKPAVQTPFYKNRLDSSPQTGFWEYLILARNKLKNAKRGVALWAPNVNNH